MLPLLRRFLFVLALFLWQGGFTFYSAVVIPTGFHVLGSHREQARITAEVAKVLNLTGVLVLPILLWDALASDPRQRRRLVRLLLWLLLALSQGGLLLLYPVLAQGFDPATRTIQDAGFKLEHAAYIWISTGQLALALVLLWLSLRSWQASDGEA
jgi:hypothetical protein